MLDLVATRDEDTLVGHLGPDVLGPDWDADRRSQTLRAQPDRTIGEALLDQRVLAGVGTFYLAETMFLLGARRGHRSRPDRPDDPVRRAARGSSSGRTTCCMLNRDRVHQVTTGDARPGHEAFVHGRSGGPAGAAARPSGSRRLGAPPADRVVFYCPTCQRGPGPDGRRDPSDRPLGSSRRAR